MSTSAVETSEKSGRASETRAPAVATADGASTPERRREQAREHAREAILEATWVALVRDGYEKITTRRIAEIAGVNIATLHYYFGNKEALLAEATRFALKETEERLQAAMDESPTGVIALRRVFDTIWDLVQERPGILRFDLVVRGFRDATARRDVLAIYTAYHRRTRALVDWMLREGGRLAPDVTEADVAHYMVAAIDGALLQHVLTGDDDAARRALEMVCRHTLELLGLAAAG